MGVNCSSGSIRDQPLESFEVYTPLVLSCSFLNIGGLTFSVKASKDACIGLFLQGNNHQPSIQVQIGSDSNRNVTIHSATLFGAQTCKDYYPYLLDEDEFRSFWVTWSSRLIAVGWGNHISHNEALRMHLDYDYVVESVKVRSVQNRAIWKNVHLFSRNYVLDHLAVCIERNPDHDDPESDRQIEPKQNTVIEDYQLGDQSIPVPSRQMPQIIS